MSMRLALAAAGSAVGVIGAGALSAMAETAATRAGLPVPTTLNDFFLPGTQPDPSGRVMDPIVGAQDGHCVNCHSGFATQYLAAEPFRNWSGSMMAQAYRDPLFVASLTVANQDASFSGDLCLRCHTPAGWYAGRSTPTDGSALAEPADFEGLTCHYCHRVVDPVYEPGVNPTQDVSILDALALQGLVPPNFGSGKIVLDPEGKVRRGPLTTQHPQGATAMFSPFHTSSEFCGSCHDVSNPELSLQPDGSYAPNALDTPHPTGDDYQMFPIERTYSEWLNSDFASTGVQMDGRFGGNHATGVMSSCQDCHMADQVGPAAANGPVYQNAPQHAFNGGSTWMLNAVRNLYADADTGLDATVVAESNNRAIGLLQNASDMALSQDEDELEVLITNYSGHKLPTGYPEGRRMWINVQFYNDDSVMFAERGHYEAATGDLTVGDTKVYETKLGLDSTMEEVTGIPAGESFHFVLNNVRLKDNRIPPMGFTNAAFEAVGAGVVDYIYDDGQYWDETEYDIPVGAVRADVRLFYQSVSREYVEFLLAENGTDSRGTTLYNQWDLLGRSAPIEMDFQSLALTPVVGPAADLNGDGVVDGADLAALLASWGPGSVPADLNGDGTVDGADLAILLASWTP
jgi:hypothetical protein